MTPFIIILILNIIHVFLTVKVTAHVWFLDQINVWLNDAKIKFVEFNQTKNVESITDFEQPRLNKHRKNVYYMIIGMELILGLFIIQLFLVSDSSLHTIGEYILSIGFPTGIILWKISSTYVDDAQNVVNIFLNLISISERQKELQEMLNKKQQIISQTEI